MKLKQTVVTDRIHKMRNFLLPDYETDILNHGLSFICALKSFSVWYISQAYSGVCYSTITFISTPPTIFPKNSVRNSTGNHPIIINYLYRISYQKLRQTSLRQSRSQGELKKPQKKEKNCSALPQKHYRTCGQGWPNRCLAN